MAVSSVKVASVVVMRVFVVVIVVVVVVVLAVVVVVVVVVLVLVVVEVVVVVVVVVVTGQGPIRLPGRYFNMNAALGSVNIRVTQVKLLESLNIAVSALEKIPDRKVDPLESKPDAIAFISVFTNMGIIGDG